MKKKKKILVITLFILVFCVIILIKQGTGIGSKVYVASDSREVGNKNIDIDENKDKEKVNLNELEDNNIKNVKKITVYISGAVQKPGIVTIDSDKRLFDAVQMIGGTTQEADLNRVNMAIKLEDEKHYIVPRIGEVISVEDGELEVGKDNGENLNANNKNSDTKNSSKVNINTADIKELETLPGIGEATASKIVQYREENGKFNYIDDIKNVNGIGEKKFENLKDKIYVN